MDVVVIGKSSYSVGDKPQVVYCGNCRVEAQEAVNKSDLVRFYEIDAHKIMRPLIKAAGSTVETKTESPKKSKSK